MRDALIFALIVAVGVLGWMLHSQNATLTDQQKQVRELDAKIEAKAKSGGLELQAQCTKQAAIAFKESGWEKEQMAGYENHYNERLNKCFVIMQNTDVKSTPGQIITSRFLSDAFEGKNLGNYFWESDRKKKYWEVAPFTCDVTVPSGEKKTCKSSDEFEELLKVYMQ
jgi:hypothetical protein